MASTDVVVIVASDQGPIKALKADGESSAMPVEQITARKLAKQRLIRTLCSCLVFAAAAAGASAATAATYYLLYHRVEHFGQEGVSFSLDTHDKPSPPPSSSLLLAVYSTRWRVVNAEPVQDHWNIGELAMYDASGRFRSHGKTAASVLCSYNYDGHDLAVVHDGYWFTGGHADRATWAGSDWGAAKQVGGSWLGYEFTEPVSVTGVRMAQGEWSAQRVQAAWLEAAQMPSSTSATALQWTRVATIAFSPNVREFEGTLSFVLSPPTPPA